MVILGIDDAPAAQLAVLDVVAKRVVQAGSARAAVQLAVLDVVANASSKQAGLEVVVCRVRPDSS